MQLKPTWKAKIAKTTGGNVNLNKSVMKLKSSWDEVEKLLGNAAKKKKK